MVLSKLHHVVRKFQHFVIIIISELKNCQLLSSLFRYFKGYILATNFSKLICANSSEYNLSSLLILSPGKQSGRL